MIIINDLIGGPAKFGDFVGYKQVCGYLNSNWKRVWVADQQVPFIFQGNIMVGYDDPESIAIKVFLALLLIYTDLTSFSY